MAAGALLWLIPMTVLTLGLGWAHPVTQMGWFFTKAALLTFGGAYAVLPYVYQGAVVNFGWLTAGQMMDGLALGETTPGPPDYGGHVCRICGRVYPCRFWRGYAVCRRRRCRLHGDLVYLSPVLHFRAAGGPFIETTHNKAGFTAPLTAITAAVVGVIVNLGLFFIWHTVWPEGAKGGIDIPAALIAVAAAFALFRLKWKVTHVIAMAALAGLILRLTGLSAV
ncbi:chromate transporter [Enterobacter asburiae]|uniref:chromate transporter n=1 Tax=Enterobacter asburiae TaxID=61645 RepID=UPI003CF4FD0C